MIVWNPKKKLWLYGIDLSVWNSIWKKVAFKQYLYSIPKTNNIFLSVLSISVLMTTVKEFINRIFFLKYKIYF